MNKRDPHFIQVFKWNEKKFITGLVFEAVRPGHPQDPVTYANDVLRMKIESEVYSSVRLRVTVDTT